MRISKKTRDNVILVAIVIIVFISYQIYMFFSNLDYQRIVRSPITYIFISIIMFFILRRYLLSKLKVLNYKFVENKSNILQNFDKTQSKYYNDLNNVKNKITCNYNFDSKHFYDLANPSQLLYEHLYNRINEYSFRLGLISKNKKLAKQYNKEVRFYQEKIQNEEKDTRLFLPESQYKKIENKIFKNKRAPDFMNELIIEIKMFYKSPKGRNQYDKTRRYFESEITDMMKKIRNDIEFNNTKQEQVKKERSKLSKKLRVLVLNRDGKKCQYCGRTPKDGVKLHVDHIQPISKGGLTVKENLQTLCDECNMGKSDMTVD